MEEKDSSFLLQLYSPDAPALLSEAVKAEEMVRLDDVGMDCGCEYTSFPRWQGIGKASRLSHSLGVARIVWHFTADEAQSMAGLLHDIATPVFAHVADFMNQDYERQESTEQATGRIIRRSAQIGEVLRRSGLTVDQVADHHRYPVCDNDTPRLSADRLEYTLKNLFRYLDVPQPAIRAMYDDLAVLADEQGVPEIGFRHAETAVEFTLQALQASRIYVADEDRCSMELLARLLKQAIADGVLDTADLYTTESAVIARLKRDPETAARWAAYRRLSHLKTSPQPHPGWIRVPAKKRYIDPLVQGLGRCSRFSPEVDRQIRDFLALDFDTWMKAE